MAVDVVEQGREQVSPARSRFRTAAAALAALAVVLAGAVQVRGDEAARDRTPEQPLRPLPRVLLDRAGVLSVEPSAGGVLQLRVGLEGVPRAQLLSLGVELPGSAVVLRPTPDRLADDGTASLALDALPRCPGALPGLSRGAVTAVVRGREGARVRQVRVRLDTAGTLADTVRRRCGTVAGVPDLRASFVELDGSVALDGSVEPDGPAAAPLPTRVAVAAAGTDPVTVVAVQPGPGLRTTVRTPLPLVVAPGGAPASVRVDLRPGGCGGAPDTPPYVLVLSTGETVATSVGPEAQPPLDALRPYECAG